MCGGSLLMRRKCPSCGSKLVSLIKDKRYLAPITLYGCVGLNCHRVYHIFPNREFREGTWADEVIDLTKGISLYEPR